MQAPPVYHKNQQQNEQEGFILTLTPLPTKVKFRTRLGLIKGELQFKLLQITRYSFQKLELELTGIEENTTKQNQLIHSNIILWSNETDDNSAVPPSLSLRILTSYPESSSKFNLTISNPFFCNMNRSTCYIVHPVHSPGPQFEFCEPRASNRPQHASPPFRPASRNHYSS
ncbi:hypothetical protein PSTG_14826 [Puccinia striiformis f. sp. tritici PST-78]|uniref:Uncharacterized protein n=1 Tax=Puccinia striiformis f. sp. tritici PST-78 TaxID=1165861 RepID=A0A0L0UXI3_9BASI|nr:hypothetical protein PSTG_14826 [Puccinia striiformis f. sp. tritici PST-78]